MVSNITYKKYLYVYYYIEVIIVIVLIWIVIMLYLIMVIMCQVVCGQLETICAVSESFSHCQVSLDNVIGIF